LRRLENEREELTAAYKEAEAVSVIGIKLIKMIQNSSVMHRCFSEQQCYASLLFRTAVLCITVIQKSSVMHHCYSEQQCYASLLFRTAVLCITVIH